MVRMVHSLLVLVTGESGTFRSMRVAFVRIPVRLMRIVRAVIDFDDNCFFAGDCRAVHVTFRIAVEAPGIQHDAARGIFVLPLRQIMNWFAEW